MKRRYGMGGAPSSACLGARNPGIPTGESIETEWDMLFMSSDATPMSMLTAGLIRLLDVEPAGEPGHFLGHRKPGGAGRVYGGQVVGQALAAAAKTVAADRPVHSLHCYFMRPGSEDYPIDYQVDADMDGRAFSNRRIVAWQQEKPIFNMIASFHKPERGPAHQSDMPPVPDPDDLKDLGDLIEQHELPAGPVLRWIAGRNSPVRFRPVGDIQSGIIKMHDAAPQLCWMRVGEGPLGLEQPMQRAMLGFISDMLLLATAYRPHGLHIGSPGVASASIDHSVWFHDDVECGDWLLYVTDSPWAGHGRGFARGHFYARDGRLVASVAQEGLIRFRDAE
ncbi:MULTISPECIES: acyl-CoA thioesterase [unclassified Sphingobium]|uniref:acyl-CoA thioesterase n=1 Tax=unclassified Sphingobium TaxID=2611147 RepID=UPI0022254394|nr:MULTISPECIES: acyl-CoA thioesterase domain-containing protein [unclassified Sphingobium]MCW2412649.1 acyl-CoA thioesterase-2 [Sphingobium sp. B8D3D]MCW2415053.1 acyl-CoA thioesterase-2 [Sphingobium sp. B8D3A]